MVSKTSTVVLDNGLRVLLEPMPTSQSASMGFFVKTGSRDEAESESGVSHFLEHMMFKGTRKRDSLQLTYDLGNIGAQSNAFTSEEVTVYYGTVVPEYVDDMVEILCDMLRSTIPQSEFDVEKNVILEEIALYQDRPTFCLYEEASEHFFSGQGSGNSVLGTHASISALSRDQMKQYFDRRYLPSNMFFSIAGAFDPDAVLARLQKDTADWVAGETSRTYRKHVPPVIGQTYKRKNLQQGHILLMAPGASSQSEDRIALNVLSGIIGDPSGSRLYWSLIDSGLAESASFDLDERDQTGFFSASASARPDSLDKVGSILRDVISNCRDVTKEEVEKAKAKLKTRLVLNGELPMGRFMALGYEWMYREKLHSLKDLMDKVQSISCDSIVQALDKYPLNNWIEYRMIPE